MEEQKEDKLGQAPDTEIKVWGLGIALKKQDLTNEKLDLLIKYLDRNNFLMSCIEKKIERLLESSKN
jgi:hypothetical protein